MWAAALIAGRKWDPPPRLAPAAWAQISALPRQARQRVLSAWERARHTARCARPAQSLGIFGGSNPHFASRKANRGGVDAPKATSCTRANSPDSEWRVAFLPIGVRLARILRNSRRAAALRR